MSTVVVDLTRSDLMSFSFRWLTKWPQLWEPFVVIFVLVVAYLLYKHGLPEDGRKWFSFVMAGAGGGIVGLILGVVFALLGVRLNAGKVPGLLGTHEYSFTPDGLLEKTQANETLIKWGGAHSLLRTESFLQINIAPGLAHILPQRAFSDRNAFEEFCAKAERLVQGHA
jgi:YcxB-like protein